MSNAFGKCISVVVAQIKPYVFVELFFALPEAIRHAQTGTPFNGLMQSLSESLEAGMKLIHSLMRRNNGDERHCRVVLRSDLFASCWAMVAPSESSAAKMKLQQHQEELLEPYFGDSQREQHLSRETMHLGADICACPTFPIRMHFATLACIKCICIEHVVFVFVFTLQTRR